MAISKFKKAILISLIVGLSLPFMATDCGAGRYRGLPIPELAGKTVRANLSSSGKELVSGDELKVTSVVTAQDLGNWSGFGKAKIAASIHLWKFNAEGSAQQLPWAPDATTYVFDPQANVYKIEITWKLVEPGEYYLADHSGRYCSANFADRSDVSGTECSPSSVSVQLGEGKDHSYGNLIVDFVGEDKLIPRFTVE